MSQTRRSLVFSALLAGVVRSQRKLSALVIDGANNHDWKSSTPVIRAILEATGRFTVGVSTSPAADASRDVWDAWRPRFEGHDVVVSNFNGGHLPESLRWPQAVEASLESYLSGGGGFVSFHAANNAFLKWAAYNEIIGLGWRDPAFGPGLVIDEHERAVVVPAGDGPMPGHGPSHDFVMTMRDPRHAITHGLPKQWLHPMEQLTHGQHFPANPKHGALEKEIQVITYAWSRDSKQREPMDWVRRWGRGRVYVTMLGHNWRDQDSPNLRCIGFRTLFARGVEWAASAKVTIPVPQKFPTANSALEISSQ